MGEDIIAQCENLVKMIKSKHPKDRTMAMEIIANNKKSGNSEYAEYVLKVLEQDKHLKNNYNQLQRKLRVLCKAAKV